MVTTTRSSTRLSAAWWPCRDRASASSLCRRPISSWTRFHASSPSSTAVSSCSTSRASRTAGAAGSVGAGPGSLPSRSASSCAGIPAMLGWSSSGSATASSPVAVKRQNAATAASRRACSPAWFASNCSSRPPSLARVSDCSRSSGSSCLSPALTCSIQLLRCAPVGPHRGSGRLERDNAGGDPQIGGGLIPFLRRLDGRAIHLGYNGLLLLHLAGGLPQRLPGTGRLAVGVPEFLVTGGGRDFVGERGQPRGRLRHTLLGHGECVPRRVDLGSHGGEPAPPRLLPRSRSDELGGRLGPGPAQRPRPPPSILAHPGQPRVVWAQADGSQDGLDDIGWYLVSRVYSATQRVRETVTSHDSQVVSAADRDTVPRRQARGDDHVMGPRFEKLAVWGHPGIEQPGRLEGCL